MESSSEDCFVDYGDEVGHGKSPLNRPAFRGALAKSAAGDFSPMD
jgi:hypothetical protein